MEQPLKAQTSDLALCSCLLGILCVVGFGTSFLIKGDDDLRGLLFSFPVILSLPAVICGQLGRFYIRRSAGRLSGEDLGSIGLTIGSLVLFIFVVLFALYFLVGLGPVISGAGDIGRFFWESSILLVLCIEVLSWNAVILWGLVALFATLKAVRIHTVRSVLETMGAIGVTWLMFYIAWTDRVVHGANESERVLPREGWIYLSLGLFAIVALIKITNSEGKS